MSRWANFLANSDTLALFQGCIEGSGRMITLDIVSGTPIIKGPSREELFDDLRLYDERRLVTFELVPSHPNFHNWRVWLRAQVVEIEAEDGSGHSWLLGVYFQDAPQQNIKLSASGRIKLYYNDRTRKGQIIKTQAS